MVLSEELQGLSTAIGMLPTTSQQILDGIVSNHHQEDTSTSSTSSSTPSPSQDSAVLDSDFDFTRVLQALNNPNSASLALSFLLNNKTPQVAKEKEKVYKPRNTRMKVYAQGYFMTFDKESSCGKKHFWRCERKNECPARMHTEVNQNVILKMIHEHNHQKPTEAELAFYNLDIKGADPNAVIPVNTVSRAIFKFRRMSKAEDDSDSHSHGSAEGQDEPRMKPSNGVLPQLLQKATSAASSSIACTSSAFTAVEPRVKTEVPDDFVPVKPTPRKRKHAEIVPAAEIDLIEIYESAKKLVKLIAKCARIPDEAEELNHEQRTPDLTLYVTMAGDSDDGEVTYHPIELHHKTDKCLKKELEKFVGFECPNNILLSVSSKINVVINDTMINSWTNSKFFKIDVTKQSWKLAQVTDATM
ncbi:unnamed protein product [Caenorhabditis bovis]|uniref:FLYWCH-type domain-containing protein n=1 Tax=Caenorhabditis bovis TaxID=2654633 RepID=A0A8S1EIE4_9PELO|nr:unnamed protein product [Caenorhabditis bovis]